jgi:hypothetical protein
LSSLYADVGDPLWRCAVSEDVMSSEAGTEGGDEDEEASDAINWWVGAGREGVSLPGDMGVSIRVVWSI